MISRSAGGRRATPAPWPMIRFEYQQHCKDKGHTHIAGNNRADWREVETAIRSGKLIPENVLKEYREVRGTKQGTRHAQ